MDIDNYLNTLLHEESKWPTKDLLKYKLFFFVKIRVN